MNAPYLSIIIPLHNEQVRLREAITKVIHYGEYHLRGRYEIILVENGSTDETWRVARELQRTYRPIRAYHLDARSKAAAVQTGMLMATGEYRYMCDVDLSTPIDELTKFLKKTQDGWDIVIASREHVDSQVETSFKRWFIGRIFHGLVLALTGMDYHDTQCGFKLFNAHAAQEIFAHTECSSMAFDVEVLYLAQLYGYYATEIPVTWHNDTDSRVRIIRDSWLMLKDLIQIKKLHIKDKPLYKQKIPA